MIARFVLCALAVAMLASCGANGGMSGDNEEAGAYTGIAADDVIHFAGNEPFWSGEIKGGEMRWSTPDNIDGQMIAVERFAGLGGLSVSGIMDGRALDMMITPAECTDTMSGAVSAFVATVSLGTDTLFGCAWLNNNTPVPVDL